MFFKLAEAIGFGSKGVDLDEVNGVLRNVKILGLESKNGKRYSKEAIAGAIPLLNDALVYLNHAETGADGEDLPRKIEDRFGRLKEVTQNAAGEAVGTLKFNPHHERAAAFCWFAKNDPIGLGMSIMGAGTGSVQPNGVRLVEAIHKISSVDIVEGPATAMSLYEQKNAKFLAEKAFSHTPTPAPKNAWLASLGEGGDEGESELDEFDANGNRVYFDTLRESARDPMLAHLTAAAFEEETHDGDVAELAAGAFADEDELYEAFTPCDYPT